jgi:catechol 2,3-dioxygenase-like lactoylglutathione lyase family enzyme
LSSFLTLPLQSKVASPRNGIFRLIVVIDMVLRYRSALVTLAAQNFEQLVEFYHHFLQQEPGVSLPESYAEFELLDLRLGIFKPKQVSGGIGEDLLPGRCLGMGLCFEVESLEATIEHLSNLGYPPPGKIITASHGREIYAYDPEGNWLILHQS